jgi:hypothetical protein
VLDVADSLPDAVYADVAAVVAEARSAGLDVGLETRRHTWRPAELYPGGLTNDDVRFVGIFGIPTERMLPNGSPAHEIIGYNTTLTVDGMHDYLTSVKDDLHVTTLGHDHREYRRTLRKLIAWTQGIAGSDSPASALQDPRGAHAPDAFSRSDIAAMMHMSGCTAG